VRRDLVRNVRKITRIPGALHVFNGIGRLSRNSGRDQLSGFPPYRTAEVRIGPEEAGSAAEAGSGDLPGPRANGSPSAS
jgi:hypothetical protein